MDDIEGSATVTTKEVCGFLRKHYAIPESVELNEDTPILEAGIIDSLAIVELISYIERRCSIVLEDEDLTGQNFETVRSIINLVESRLK